MQLHDYVILALLLIITYLVVNGCRLPQFKLPRMPRLTKPVMEQYDEDLHRIEVYPPSPGWNFGPNCPEYHYFCKCGAQLTEGPCGGAAINAVCKPCKINYGNLPGCFVP